MHNITHFFTEFGENEFSFNAGTVAEFIRHFPVEPVTSLFSFFGWMGVSFFVFATGFGLFAKYGTQPLRIGNWILRHYLKLFFLLLPTYLVFLLYRLWFEGSTLTLNEVLEQLLVLNVYKPGEITPGIYWYIGMAFQLCVWFLILRRLSYRYLIVALFMAMAINAFTPPGFMSYFRHNSIGWLPELLLGMILARREAPAMGDKARSVLLLVGLLMVGVCALWRHTYTFSGLFLCLAIVASRKWLMHIPGLLFMGRISAAIYVVHAVVRAAWFTLFRSIEIAPWGIALIVLAVSILLSCPYTWYYNGISSYLNKKITAKRFVQQGRQSVESRATGGADGVGG